MKAQKPNGGESGMTLRPLLRVTGALEAVMAVAFVLWPSLPLTILFGQSPDTALALLAGRIGGAALLSLAMACWWAGDDPESRAASGLVAAMLLYDAVAFVLLVYARMVAGLSGIGLWPAVVVHAALGVWCIVSLRHKHPRRIQPTP
jgi:hypothetical protein